MGQGIGISDPKKCREVRDVGDLCFPELPLEPSSSSNKKWTNKQTNTGEAVPNCYKNLQFNNYWVHYAHQTFLPII